jgi:uncharacterized protein
MKLGRLRRRTGGVIDRREEGPAGGRGGLGGLPGFPTGGGGRLPIPGGNKGGIGIGGIVLILVLLFLLPRCLGSSGSLIPNPGAVEGFPDIGTGGGSSTEVDPTDPTGQFVDAVQDDIQVAWEEEFQRAGKTYQPTQVVLYRGSTRTGCGLGTAQTGPFYCPLDRRVYLDFSFFRELEQRFGASGDFAQAYVIAHEIGHHVQTLLGISEQVTQASQQDPSRRNELSIRQELQPTAWPACGSSPPTPRECWSRVTWKKASAPRPRSATTGSRRRSTDGSSPSRGPTVRRSSG